MYIYIHIYIITTTKKGKTKTNKITEHLKAEVEVKGN